MITEAQIGDKLRTIDQYRLERLVTHLLYQGAFSDIVQPHSFIQSFGTNPDKERTIKSPGHADAELRNLGVHIESSVNEGWSGKFVRDVEKNRGRPIKVFIFCTNQNTGSNHIRVDGFEGTAEQYGRDQLACETCFIMGRNELRYPLQEPQFSHLRRQFLDIPEEHFHPPARFLQSIRLNPGYRTSVEEIRLQAYGAEVGAALSFSPDELTILHSDDYITLLHALGLWADAESERQKEQAITMDHCFINWPAPVAALQDVDQRELSPEVDSFLYVWGANDITNLSEYLKFWRDGVSLVFVTPTAFKEEVARRLNSSGTAFSPRYVTLPSLDRRSVDLREVAEHEGKLRSFMEAALDHLKQLEALVYFYSPVRLSDPHIRTKMCGVMSIEEERFSQLTNLLVQSEVAAITGEIIWLKEPGVAKKLLDDFITRGVFPIESLV